MSLTGDRLRRWWRLLVPRRDSVARPSDRVQAVLLLVAVAIGLVALPVSAAVGSELYARQMQVSAEQHAQRSPVIAVLLADSVAATPGGRVDLPGGSVAADATWQTPDGSTHTGRVRSRTGMHRGDEVPIWIDRSGHPADAPLSSGTVLADAVSAGAGLWSVICLVLASGYGLAVAGLNRRRLARWQQEWDAGDAKHTPS
ncbi:hypothetical protein [Amycolatopsis sp. PS_44_ISF1]|uniref:Rv1733c family protein n=1 Tax=Amycolatopsis sp. PS_44_ISF1 TaxID=2974917 RepID=UPI0028DDA222|nr:hypothetical protein [Amycolatopsis sp. PS_44_ISF1]MDT8913657.1 hypothetical protein [Amycolatopsis sp. PS_44_ISF1]